MALAMVRPMPLPAPLAVRDEKNRDQHGARAGDDDQAHRGEEPPGQAQGVRPG
jgi:hypothetical protein